MPCDISGSYDWVVVSTESIIQASSEVYNFTDLANYHAGNDSANCAIVAMEDIYACESYWNTTNATRNDSAAHLWQFVKDANTNYLWKDSKGKGSLSLNIENVFEKGKDVLGIK